MLDAMNGDENLSMDFRRLTTEEFLRVRRENEQLASQRGAYLQLVIHVESMIDMVIRYHFDLLPERAAEFDSLVLWRLDLSAKVEVLDAIVRNTAVLAELEETRNLTRRLDDMRDFRNMCAHASTRHVATEHGHEILHLTGYSRRGRVKKVRVDEKSMERETEKVRVLLMDMNLIAAKASELLADRIVGQRSRRR